MKQLRESDEAGSYAVASVFIRSVARRRNANPPPLATTTAILRSILRQLYPVHEDELGALSMDRLLEAILRHAAGFSRIYLIIDGAQCLPDSGSDLEQQICWLQEQLPQRFNVLITSRALPILDSDLHYYITPKYCDGQPSTDGHDIRGHPLESPNTRLPFFWVCRNHDSFALCRACYEKNPIKCFDWYVVTGADVLGNAIPI